MSRPPPPEENHFDKRPLTRAARLLAEYFKLDTAPTRQTIFHEAFEGVAPNPCGEIEFTGAADHFAAHAAQKLDNFGYFRGRHAFSILLSALAKRRGRQLNPDFINLPRELDAAHPLPTRQEEERHLQRVLEYARPKSQDFVTLDAHHDNLPPPVENDDPQIEVLLTHLYGPQSRPAEPIPYHDILDAFRAVPRAVLLGEPGSGKSTTLRKLAVNLAAEERRIPILAELNRWTGVEPLTEFLASHAEPAIVWAIPALAKAGRLVLLLDGLNEIPTHQRAVKIQQVRELLDDTLIPSGASFYASCREKDYVNDLRLGGALDTLTLEPLTPARILDALRQRVANRQLPPESADRLFWQLAGDERLASIYARSGATLASFWNAAENQKYKPESRINFGEYQLWRQHVTNERSLMKLAANPYLLNMLWSVWHHQRELPKNRGRLFDSFIFTLLARERLLDLKTHQPNPAGETLLACVTALAWRMQQESLVSASRDTALAAFHPDPALLARALASTILEEQDEQFRFRHQLLQEYFTARALRGQLDILPAAELWPSAQWWRRTGWEETAVLLAGLYPDQDCSPVVRWLAEAQPEVAAQCIAGSGASIPEPLRDELQTAWRSRLDGVGAEPLPEARAAIGRALGLAGLDNRPGVGLRPDGVPDIAWIPIAAGQFIYQGEELPRSIDEAFEIARYPVTNLQYQAFLDAPDGHCDNRWWKGLTKPDRTPGISAWTESNHPRERVSWHEAMAFCAWLGVKLCRKVRLPTEWEWERAARGTEGRIYPWGNEYLEGFANIDETWGKAGPQNLGRTSAVGIYPKGASAEGVLDLAGNVGEWCLNEYEPPHKIRSGGTKSRVLRGGSWDLNQEFARAACRSYYRPVVRYNYLGFRVVCSSPIR